MAAGAVYSALEHLQPPYTPNNFHCATPRTLLRLNWLIPTYQMMIATLTVSSSLNLPQYNGHSPSLTRFTELASFDVTPPFTAGRPNANTAQVIEFTTYFAHNGCNSFIFISANIRLLVGEWGLAGLIQIWGFLFIESNFLVTFDFTTNSQPALSLFLSLTQIYPVLIILRVLYQFSCSPQFHWFQIRQGKRSVGHRPASGRRY